MRVTNWNNPSPPRPDQIDLMQPLDLSHPLARRLRFASMNIVGRGSNRATDWGPTRKHGTLTNMTSDDWVWVPGRGIMLDFDGSNDFVTLGAQSVGGVNLLASAGNPWSVVIQVVWRADGTAIARASATGANRTFQLFRSGGLIATYLRGSLWTAAGGAAVNVVYDYAVTWDGTNALYYRDGGLVIQALPVGAAAEEAENIIIGARTGGTGFFHNGRIGPCLIYNRALSAAEVFNLWHPGRRWGMLRTLTGRTTVYVPAAAAAFKPYWIPQRNRMIGATL
jgi:hypothetical protein